MHFFVREEKNNTAGTRFAHDVPAVFYSSCSPSPRADVSKGASVGPGSATDPSAGGASSAPFSGGAVSVPSADGASSTPSAAALRPPRRQAVRRIPAGAVRAWSDTRPGELGLIVVLAEEPIACLDLHPAHHEQVEQQEQHAGERKQRARGQTRRAVGEHDPRCRPRRRGRRRSRNRPFPP